MIGPRVKSELVVWECNRNCEIKASRKEIYMKKIIVGNGEEDFCVGMKSDA